MFRGGGFREASFFHALASDRIWAQKRCWLKSYNNHVPLVKVLSIPKLERFLPAEALFEVFPRLLMVPEIPVKWPWFQKPFLNPPQHLQFFEWSLMTFQWSLPRLSKWTARFKKLSIKKWTPKNECHRIKSSGSWTTKSEMIEVEDLVSIVRVKVDIDNSAPSQVSGLDQNPQIPFTRASEHA